MKQLMMAATLIQNAGLGISGEDLYIGTIPADVKKGIMLRSPLTGAEIDEGMSDFYDTMFVVIVRDPEPDVGYARCLAISRALKVDRYETDELYVLKMNPRTLPVSYPRGDADNIETSVQMHIAFGEKPQA